jgi:hypothetical protein
LDVQGISIKGNTNCTSIFYARDVARSRFIDINVFEANNATGIGFNLLGVQLNYFESCYCSQNRQAMSFPPNIGCYMAVSSMLLNSTNNTFIRCYMEGGVTAGDMKFGYWLQTADQNTFIGGAAEALRTYGLLISTTSKMNTFIGTGFESASSTADIADAGTNNTFINCYSSKVLSLQGSRGLVQGGYHERIEIISAGNRNTIDSAVVNNWASGSGGLVDAGTGTRSTNVYDIDTASYKTDIKPRFLAYVPASVTNATGNGLASVLSMSEFYDDNNNFVGTTFTAPIAGRYQFCATVSLSALSTAATLGTFEIVTTQKTYINQYGLNPKAGALQTAMTISVVAFMSAGDTAFARVTVAGMAGDTATIIGNGSNLWSTFSGVLV